jgi:RNA polymerase sporulation-specific sigma factor
LPENGSRAARGAIIGGTGARMYSLLVVFALCNLVYLALHITSGGSFPKPLSAKEERECLEKIREGDSDAKNKLIEHNLRLVAHIIKVCCYKL